MPIVDVESKLPSQLMSLIETQKYLRNSRIGQALAVDLLGITVAKLPTQKVYAETERLIEVA